MTSVVPLDEANDESTFGAKAVGLGDALRAGLPVPTGFALGASVVEAVSAGVSDAVEEVTKAATSLAGPLAARSSCVDEDGAQASFAGQHLTVLNVPSADGLETAIREIWWSANSDSAITYRQRVGLFSRPRVGVVVQVLLDPDVAGVMFTRNPVNGADERVIEASWGLGEAVVAGRVIPDNFRLSSSGEIIDRRPGLKKIAIRARPDGGTVDEVVAPDRIESPCLDDAQLAQLHALAARCEEVYGPGRDIEFAFADGRLHLLQCRAVTGAGTTPAPTAPGPGTAKAATRFRAVGPIEALARVPLFAGLDPREAEQVAQLFKQRRFSEGETVAKEGAGGAAFFVIGSGEAIVTMHGVERATLGPGDHFGEIALIDEGYRSATITARTDLVCHGLTLWDFRPLVQGNGTIAWKLLQSVVARLREAQAD